MPQTEKQNLTVSLSTQVVQMARILAAKRSTSISALVAEQVEALVSADEAYEAAQRDALSLMKPGFHLGGVHRINRDELHDR